MHIPELSSIGLLSLDEHHNLGLFRLLSYVPSIGQSKLTLNTQELFRFSPIGQLFPAGCTAAISRQSAWRRDRQRREQPGQTRPRFRYTEQAAGLPAVDLMFHRA